jgi:hypothetical protein
MIGFFSDVAEYQMPREQYLKNARDGAAIPFAIT